ncbi:MAG TPA: flagellar filament capping protein FliD [Candidatus Methylomirabilis sp.]|nr:flagellar filament capping protein FliD [Candidatus Methylomirabilis sp.]
MASVGGLSDIQGLVAQLIGLERSQGPIALYQKQQQDLTLRSASLTDLRTNLGALNSQVQSLMQPGSLSPFQAKAVASSDTGVVTATATASALGGTHTLFVTQLAKQAKVVSNQLVQTDTGVAAAVGGGDQTFRITVAGVDTDVTVTVGVGDTNNTILSNMATAINDSEAEVTASVVTDTSSTARLVITSNKTGSADAVTLSDVTGTLLASTGTNSGTAYSGSSGGYLYAVAELDAVFTLDGLTITRGSNTAADVLGGLTLSLLATQSSGTTPVTLSVGPDQAAIQAKVQGFLDAYNTTIKYLKERTGTTATTTTSASGLTEVGDVRRGILEDLPAFLGLVMNLRADVGGRISTAALGGPASLPEIGITAASDGTLSISDATKFKDALTKNPEGVTTLFSSADGIASRVSARLAGFIQAGGTLDTSVDSVTSQISSLNSLISEQEDLLKIKQEMLLKQYTALLDVVARLNTQQDMLNSLSVIGILA